MGNKLGWLLGGLILVIVGVILLMTVAFPQPSPPTTATLTTGVLDFVDVGASAALILGKVPDAAGNAAEDYHAAVTVYKENRPAITRAAEDAGELMEGRVSLDGNLLEVLTRIDSLIARGGAKAEMQYSFVYTPKRFDVGFEYEAAVNLKDLSDSLEILALHHIGKKEYARAEKVFLHQFALGRHMINERCRADMVWKGLAVQSSALDGLGMVYYRQDNPGDRPKTLKALKDYSSHLQLMYDFWETKYRIVWSTRPQPGDVFNVIENDKDRAWRIQGLLALGIIKFTATSRGDARYAAKLMEQNISSDDPMAAAAATAARELTETQFNQLGAKRFFY